MRCRVDEQLLDRIFELAALDEFTRSVQHLEPPFPCLESDDRLAAHAECEVSAGSRLRFGCAVSMTHHPANDARQVVSQIVERALVQIVDADSVLQLVPLPVVGWQLVVLHHHAVADPAAKVPRHSCFAVRPCLRISTRAQQLALRRPEAVERGSEHGTTPPQATRAENCHLFRRRRSPPLHSSQPCPEMVGHDEPAVARVGADNAVLVDKL
jgi:hypothetical protein